MIWPPVDQPPHADAVVLLSGDGARLPVALRLMDRHVAPTLVFVGQPDIVAVADLCRTPQAFEVVCLRPTPDNTRTEAQVASRLARQRGWHTMTVVTSRFHVLRARLLFRRCFDGRVEAVGDYPHYGWQFARRAVVHEWFGLVHSSLFARGC
ncbi:MAG: YdcF family protein [Acidimicrobiales bacterium]